MPIHVYQASAPGQNHQHGGSQSLELSVRIIGIHKQAIKGSTAAGHDRTTTPALAAPSPPVYTGNKPSPVRDSQREAQ